MLSREKPGLDQLESWTFHEGVKLMQKLEGGGLSLPSHSLSVFLFPPSSFPRLCLFSRTCHQACPQMGCGLPTSRFGNLHFERFCNHTSQGSCIVGKINRLVVYLVKGIYFKNLGNSQNHQGGLENQIWHMSWDERLGIRTTAAHRGAAGPLGWCGCWPRCHGLPTWVLAPWGTPLPLLKLSAAAHSESSMRLSWWSLLSHQISAQNLNDPWSPVLHLEYTQSLNRSHKWGLAAAEHPQGHISL